jgi:hypothetical protein
MRPPKYPLSVLAQVRGRTLEEAVRRLSRAVKARIAAASVLEEAEALRREHQRAAAHADEGERAALARGELTAADLARAGAWARRVEAERANLDAGVTRAASAEAEAAGAESEAQALLTLRRADANAVDRDRARWEAHEKYAAEAKAEEAAAESWRRKR